MHKLMLQLKRNASLFLLTAIMLVGCAGQRLHDEGMSLLEQGKNEEGLAKLEEASKADPDNFHYRNALMHNREKIVNKMLATANDERAAEHLDAAQAAYEHALKIDQSSTSAKTGIESLAMDRRHAKMIAEAESLLKKGDLEAARASLKPVLLENPRNTQASLLQRQIEEQVAKGLSAEPTLQGKFKKPVTLQFRDANLKMVFEALSRTSGINVLIDKDVRPDIKTSIFVKDVSVEDAIDLILLQNQLEKKIISDNTVFIYPNTAAKLKDYQDLKIRSFHLTNADPKQMLTMIKTLLKTKDIFIHEKTNSIVIRDTPEAIRLAEKMIADQDIIDPEVMLEVEVLEVSTTRLSELGIKWPNTLTLTSPTSSAVTLNNSNQNTVDKPGTFGQLRNTPLNDYTASSLSLAIHLMLQDSDTNLIASPRIRVRNHEKAKIMIGDRVPVITNAVTPLATGAPVVTGSIQYLDVGMKLEVEPEVHLDNDVTIKINLDVSSIVKQINTSSGTQAYQIGTRNATTVLRIKDGETQILAGLISKEDRETADKVPGLGQLPILGRLFSNHANTGNKSEIVLSITPRIVGNKHLPSAREIEYWSGTESTLRSKSSIMKPLGTAGFTGSSSVTPGMPAVRPQQPATLPQQPAALSPPAPTQLPTGGDTTVPGGPVKPGAASAAETMQPGVLSWQGPNQAKVGDKINLVLNTSSPLGAKSLGFRVGYDPSTLKAVDVIEGDSMKQDNSPSNIIKTINQQKGLIQVGLSGKGEGGGSNIVTLVFEATKAAPSSHITISQITSAAIGGGALALAAPEPHAIAVAQ